MRHSLRFRLLANFFLPIFIFIPLIGLALTYLLENQVFLPALAKEMTAEGTIIADDLRQDPKTWARQAGAQKRIDQMALPSLLRVDLLDPHGRLLATNQAEDRSLMGQTYPGIPVTGAPDGSGQWKINPRGSGSVPVLEVFIPITGANEQVLGEVRLSRRLSDLDKGLQEARDWIIAILLIALLFNAVLGLLLSTRIARPLHMMTQAINRASLEGKPERIAEPGLPELDSLAQAFNQLQERRYEIEVTREQMLANLVHELGRPLGSLQTAAHALTSGAEANAELRLDLLRGMAQRIEWLGHLVNDLTLAYLPQRSLELRGLPFEPGPWLNNMASLWAETARQKGIEWETSYPDNLPVIIGDPERLEQALGNLVSNAIKFTPPGGRVSLSAGVDAGQFWVAVADNGPGISIEDAQHLFDPFFRAAPTALKAPGLGLGLSIARTIAEAHGGMIIVKSQFGKGSVFTLCLPFHV